MRILHISTRLILGGSQENTILSCEGQARLGHKVHLAYGPIYGPEGSMLDRLHDFNRRCETGDELVRPIARHLPKRDPGERVVPIVLHEVPHLIREINPLTDYLCLRELKDLIHRIGPDIVHTHSSKAGILGRAAAWSFQRNGGKPLDTPPPGILHTIHGPPFMPADGSPLSRLNTHTKNTLYTLAERHAAKRCHIIISVADAMTELFLSKSIGHEEQYITVYSGMETEDFLHAPTGQDRHASRAALGLADNDLVIGTVARLAEHKGHDDLLDALGADLKANPNFKLLWVGDGWWRDRLLAKARNLRLSIRELDRLQPTAAAIPSPRTDSTHGQLILTGLVPPARVPTLIRAMDILAHPSYREGLPRTVPQALLCGVVPIAYDVDGTGEICRDQVTGRLIPLADRPKLRQAILDLAHHPEERARMAVLGRDECADRFSADRMVAELEGLYTRALHMARNNASPSPT
ncbi:MAG: glycosyltransferase [Phycisphaerales bacterium]|nr:glycosyltransferase [Phycisphaerales bacterium]